MFSALWPYQKCLHFFGFIVFKICDLKSCVFNFLVLVFNKLYFLVNIGKNKLAKHKPLKGKFRSPSDRSVSWLIVRGGKHSLMRGLVSFFTILWKMGKPKNCALVSIHSHANSLLSETLLVLWRAPLTIFAAVYWIFSNLAFCLEFSELKYTGRE